MQPPSQALSGIPLTPCRAASWSKVICFAFAALTTSHQHSALEIPQMYYLAASVGPKSGEFEWILCLGSHEAAGGVGRTSLSLESGGGGNLLPGSFSHWGCRTEVWDSCSLLARGQSLLLETVPIPLHAFQVAPARSGDETLSCFKSVWSLLLPHLSDSN